MVFAVMYKYIIRTSNGIITAIFARKLVIGTFAFICLIVILRRHFFDKSSTWLSLQLRWMIIDTARVGGFMNVEPVITRHETMILEATNR